MSVRRVVLAMAVVLAVLATTGCDRYIEEVTIGADGSASVVIEAEINCTDDDAIELWGGDPCAFLDELAANGVVSPGPSDFESFALGAHVDAFDVTGEAGRRSVRADWTEPVESLSTLTTGAGRIEEVDESATRLTLSGGDTPLPRAAAGGIPGRWTAGEFRVVAPERVVEHNGDRVVERTVIWLIDDDMPDEYTITWTEEQRDLRVWWLVLGIAVLGIVLTMIVLIEGPRAEAARARRHEAKHGV